MYALGTRSWIYAKPSIGTSSKLHQWKECFVTWTLFCYHNKIVCKPIQVPQFFNNATQSVLR